MAFGSAESWTSPEHNMFFFFLPQTSFGTFSKNAIGPLASKPYGRRLLCLLCGVWTYSLHAHGCTRGRVCVCVCVCACVCAGCVCVTQHTFQQLYDEPWVKSLHFSDHHVHMLDMFLGAQTMSTMSHNGSTVLNTCDQYICSQWKKGKSKIRSQNKRT